MILPLVILYVVTLVYLSITERFRTYASIIGLQGWILFGVALLRLHRIDLPELLFISVETLLFKALLVPALLFAVIRRVVKERSMTVIIITHNSALTAMADRVIQVKNGAVTSEEVNASPVPVEDIEW